MLSPVRLSHGWIYFYAFCGPPRGGRIKMLHPDRLVSPIFSKQESYKNFKFSENIALGKSN